MTGVVNWVGGVVGKKEITQACRKNLFQTKKENGWARDPQGTSDCFLFYKAAATFCCAPKIAACC